MEETTLQPPRDSTIRIALGAVSTLLATFAPPVCAQLPSAPGYSVEIYAAAPEPVRLSFDEASGVLYVGRDLADPRAPTRVHRIGPGGVPVEPFGDPAVSDPDAPLFDALGEISGAAGAVLVGGLNESPPDRGLISAIAPDGSLSTLFGPSESYLNPTDMTFDRTGRLLFVDAGIDAGVPLSVFVSSGAEPQPLITFPVGQRPVAIAVDLENRIYTSAIGRTTIQVHDSDGVLLDPAFATGLPEALLAFGRGGAFGTDLWAIAGGDLVRIDALGGKTVAGSGFGAATGVTFGPDGSLYVAEKANDRILRIAGLSGGPGAIPSSTLRVSKEGPTGRIVLEWFPSCSADATDYAVFEGLLGQWYTHSPVTCTDTAADFREVITPSAGDTYYLLVPLDQATEGSYGVDSAGIERPTGAPGCAGGQSVGCPR